jgi:hypothetical protein
MPDKVGQCRPLRGKITELNSLCELWRNDRSSLMIVGVVLWSLRMRSSPSIVPADRLDRDIYIVLEDFGARAGCAWREMDEAETDLEAVLQGLLSGQYLYPVRIVCFNAIERWSRDATSEVADALAQRAVDSDDDLSAALEGFIGANATRRFDVQLALPLERHDFPRGAGSWSERSSRSHDEQL